MSGAAIGLHEDAEEEVLCANPEVPGSPRLREGQFYDLLQD
jgi:hypothetical protein